VCTISSSSKFNIIHFNSIDSTAKYALEKFEQLNHQDVVTAGQQTAGHGQFDRQWFSPVGNVYLTIVLKELSVPPESMLVISADALIETLSYYGVKDAKRKLPNDILIAGKKVAGILIKNIYRGHHLRGMMISIGVNVNMTIPQLLKIDQPATSVRELLDMQIKEEDFILKLLSFFKIE